MTTTADVLAMLDELIRLIILDTESKQSFQVRGYENARRGIETFGRDVTTLSATELTAIAGVGKSTAAKIRELVDTGTAAKLDDLRAKYPAEFVELSQIPGVGPKTLKMMRSKLGIENLEMLVAAIEDGQIRTLPRMGAQSEAKIAKAIKRLGMGGGDRRIPSVQAMTIATRLVDDLGALPFVENVQYCGSLRRMAETVGDIDIAVASLDSTAVTDTVLNHPLTHEVVGSGSTKTTFITRSNVSVDVRVVKPESFGAATLYFTGSKAHNVALRQRAIAADMLLNEYGLFPNGSDKPVAAANEDDIYSALGLSPIPPPMREDTGEIQAAANASLPSVVQLNDIKGDLHFHTDQSGDGRTSLPDMVAAAAARGYEYLAITEHGEELSINGSSKLELEAHRDAIAEVQIDYPDMTLLWGCELNIGPTGELDYDPDFRSSFDYTVASIHSHFDGTSRNQTARMVKAISDPTVHSIGHLTGRYIGRRPGIELEIDVLLEALFHFDVALEINGALDRMDASAEVVRKAVERGVKLAINSDSHHHLDLRRTEWGVAIAQKGWAPAELIINTWPRDKFLAWVESKKG